MGVRTGVGVGGGGGVGVGVGVSSGIGVGVGEGVGGGVVVGIGVGAGVGVGVGMGVRAGIALGIAVGPPQAEKTREATNNTKRQAHFIRNPPLSGPNPFLPLPSCHYLSPDFHPAALQDSAVAVASCLMPLL